MSQLIEILMLVNAALVAVWLCGDCFRVQSLSCFPASKAGGIKKWVSLFAVEEFQRTCSQPWPQPHPAPTPVGWTGMPIVSQTSLTLDFTAPVPCSQVPVESLQPQESGDVCHWQQTKVFFCFVLFCFLCFRNKESNNRTWVKKFSVHKLLANWRRYGFNQFSIFFNFHLRTGQRRHQKHTFRFLFQPCMQMSAYLIKNAWFTYVIMKYQKACHTKVSKRSSGEFHGDISWLLFHFFHPVHL